MKHITRIALKNNKILQFASDLHLEKRSFKQIKPNGDYLALCGDIGNPFSKSYHDFIKDMSCSFDKVFLISGNHEYWQNKYCMSDVDDKITNLANNFNNVNYLNKSIVDIDDYQILGCTLWSSRDILSVDNSKIRINNKNVTINDINNLHYQHVQFINENINKPCIVLTHHLPTYQLVETKYRVGTFSKFRSLYSSNLENYIREPIYAWLCGHSHSNHSCYVNNVFCGINARHVYI